MPKQGGNLPQRLLDIRSGPKRLLHAPDGTTTAQVHQNGTVLIGKSETTLQKNSPKDE